MVLRPRGRGRVGRRRHLIRNAPLHRGGAFRVSRYLPVAHAAAPARPSLACSPDMTLSRVALAGAGAAAAAAAVLFRRERSRRTTERLAAAALETLLNAIDANDPETGAHVRRVAALLRSSWAMRPSSRRARVQEHRAQSPSSTTSGRFTKRSSTSSTTTASSLPRIVEPSPRTRIAAPTCSRR